MWGGMSDEGSSDGRYVHCRHHICSPTTRNEPRSIVLLKHQHSDGVTLYHNNPRSSDSSLVIAACRRTCALCNCQTCVFEASSVWAKQQQPSESRHHTWAGRRQHRLLEDRADTAVQCSDSASTSSHRSLFICNLPSCIAYVLDADSELSQRSIATTNDDLGLLVHIRVATQLMRL